jgi:uncharacterized alpha-E superfamily protein
LRLVRSLCTSLMDSEAALHTAGETLARLLQLLIAWGALDEDAFDLTALAAAREALHDSDSLGSVANLVRSARRTASSMRERLSADFWTLLLDLEASLAERPGAAPSESEALQRAEAALRTLASLSGLAQENMNRGAGWRFLDMGRRVERAVNTCRIVRTLAHAEATVDDLDLVLDLIDSQITYRARYLVGVAMTPVRDMVMLDPFNPRSVAFQVAAMKEHLAALPSLLEDGMMEQPNRILLPIAAQLEASDAAGLDEEAVLAIEQTLLRLSSAVSDRYFLQGANAAPTVKLSGLG